MQGEFSRTGGVGATPKPLEPNGPDIAAHLYALFSPEFVHGFPDAEIEVV